MKRIPVSALGIPAEETPWIVNCYPDDGWAFEDTCITVTFSHTLDTSADFSKYIRIEPFVPCRINCYNQDNTLYIWPHEFLDYNMVYTVTVFPGVPTVSGKRTKAGTSFSFRVENTYNTPRKTSRNIGDHIRLSLPGGGHDITVHFNRETPLRLTAQNSLWGGVPKIISCSTHCTVYRYHNTKEAVQALLTYEKNKWRHHCDTYRFPYRHLEKADEYILEDLSGKSTTDPRMYEFDLTVRPLPPGCYLLRCMMDAVYPEGVYEPYELPKTICGQIILQVLECTNTEIHMEMRGDMLQVDIPSMENRTLTAHLYSISDDGLNQFIHVKDAASIRTLSCRTDKAGTALMPTFGKNRALVLFGKGGKAFFRRFSWDTPKVPERKIRIDTDRMIYGFSDTIHFSGTITPSEGLHRLYLFSDPTEKALPVPVQPDGSFRGELSYSDFKAHKIVLWMDEPGKGGIAWIERQVRDVFHRRSPVWMALDKTEFRRGEPVSATVHAVNADGSPAVGQEFQWRCLSDDQSSGAYGRICTDESGTAHIIFVPKEIKGSLPGTDLRKYYTLDVDSISGTYFWEKERFVYE